MNSSLQVSSPLYQSLEREEIYPMHLYLLCHYYVLPIANLSTLVKDHSLDQRIQVMITFIYKECLLFASYSSKHS